MAVSPGNFIQGPANLWLAAFGATEPATPSTAFATPWVDLGATKEGVDLEVADEYSELTVDQLVHVVERRRIARAFTVKTALAEGTLANLARALNDAAPTSAAGVDTFEPGADDTLFAPGYAAIGVDGIAPNGKRRRGIFRKMLQTDSVAMSYKKDGQLVIPVTFSGHWVSQSIRPFIYKDITA